MAAAGKRSEAPDGLSSALVSKRQRVESTTLAIASTSKSQNADIKRTSDLAAPIMRLEGHEGEVFACKFSPDGDLFASAGHDKSVFLWRPLHPECENFAVLRGHKSAILELHWSADSERIVTASPDASVRAWDVSTGTQVKNMAEHSDVVNSCHVLQRGAPLVVSGSEDTTIKVWDLRSKRSIQTLQDKYQLLSVCFGDAGDTVYSAGIENTVKVWDLRTEKVSFELRGHGDSVTGMALHPDGKSLLTNSMDNTLRVWDVRPYAPANRCTHILSGHQHTFEKHLLKCAWSGDGARVTAGSGDRMVCVWEVHGQKLVYKLPGHSGSVNEAVFHPRQPIVASASSDGTIYLGEIAPMGE